MMIKKPLPGIAGLETTKRHSEKAITLQLRKLINHFRDISVCVN